MAYVNGQRTGEQHAARRFLHRTAGICLPWPNRSILERASGRYHGYQRQGDEVQRRQSHSLVLNCYHDWPYHSSSTHLCAIDRQYSVAGQDRQQDIHHVSRTTCKGSECATNREKRRHGKTDATALSMILFRHAPGGPTNTMSCVIRPEQKLDSSREVLNDVHTPAHIANWFVCTLVRIEK